MWFSQRYGHKPIRTKLQIEEMDNELRAGLWNMIYASYNWDSMRDFYSVYYDEFFKDIMADFFKKPVIGRLNPDDVFKFFSKWFIDKASWDEIYSFIEFLLSISRDDVLNSGEFQELSDGINKILEQEISGYRLVNGKFVPITNEVEIEEIEQAQLPKNRWKTVSEHISTAVDQAFRRKKPDYRNAIKEAISAVESACRIITGNNKATLGQALKTLEKAGVKLHPAYQEGFSRLYGYTSDEDGIRHGGIDMAQVSFEDAKFMIVACSAFVNYLKAQSK